MGLQGYKHSWKENRRHANSNEDPARFALQWNQNNSSLAPTFNRHKPISLTSALAKLMSEKAGFRPQRSTNKQEATFSQHTEHALVARNTLTAVFVDFKSAYDLVWKEKLILKLAKIGIKHYMLNWIKAFIGQRSCIVRHGNALSKSNLLQTGLPQGAVTSCTLFNVFINYVAELVQTVTGIKYLLYADDHVPWNSAPKKNAKERTDSAIIGVEWLSTPRKLHSKPILWPDTA
ncbi:unnamed protein product [Rodentolepis nana]|uniref:Reverse transcriptase domain-containing protein n=1 Tax=Rodentolepis nana TaxID=102285 RepID=A0A0R3TXB7_RODNA|nr:unnamed protein product [Rodentolepis nana]